MNDQEAIHPISRRRQGQEALEALEAMTSEMMAFQGLLEKTSDADLLREMLGFAAERLMELGVGIKTGAAWGEKSGERLAQCRGYRERV